MARIMSVLFSTLLLAVAGASGAAAQATGCQPTLTQPCAKPQTRPSNDQSSQRGSTAKSDDAPSDRPRRLPINKDTDLNWGFGGIGVGRKF
jgi:hypothetical protein